MAKRSTQVERPITGEEAQLAAARDRACLRITGMGWHELASEIENEKPPAAGREGSLAEARTGGAHLARLLRHTARCAHHTAQALQEAADDDDVFVHAVHAANLHTAARGLSPIGDQAFVRVVMVCPVEHLHDRLYSELHSPRHPADTTVRQAVTLYQNEDEVHTDLAGAPRVTVRPWTESGFGHLAQVHTPDTAASLPLPGWRAMSHNIDTAQDPFVFDTDTDATATIVEFIDRLRCFARWGTTD